MGKSSSFHFLACFDLLSLTDLGFLILYRPLRPHPGKCPSTLRWTTALTWLRTAKAHTKSTLQPTCQRPYAEKTSKTSARVCSEIKSKEWASPQLTCQSLKRPQAVAADRRPLSHTTRSTWFNSTGMVTKIRESSIKMAWRVSIIVFKRLIDTIVLFVALLYTDCHMSFKRGLYRIESDNDRNSTYLEVKRDGEAGW